MSIKNPAAKPAIENDRMRALRSIKAEHYDAMNSLIALHRKLNEAGIDNSSVLAAMSLVEEIGEQVTQEYGYLAFLRDMPNLRRKR